MYFNAKNKKVDLLYFIWLCGSKLRAHRVRGTRNTSDARCVPSKKKRNNLRLRASFHIFLRSYDFSLNKVLYLMIKKEKFDREVIIIFICLNTFFIFSANYFYCKNWKMRCLTWQILTYYYLFKHGSLSMLHTKVSKYTYLYFINFCRMTFW